MNRGGDFRFAPRNLMGGVGAGRSRSHIVCILLVVILLALRFFLVTPPSVDLSESRIKHTSLVRAGRAEPGSKGEDAQMAITADPKAKVPAWVSEALPSFEPSDSPSVKRRPPMLDSADPDDDAARLAVLALLERVILGPSTTSTATGAADDDSSPSATAALADLQERRAFHDALLKVFDVRVEEMAGTEFAKKHASVGPEFEVHHSWCHEAVSPVQPECYRFYLLRREIAAAAPGGAAGQHHGVADGDRAATATASGLEPEQLQLFATSRVAASRGVYFMLKRYLNSSVMWGLGRSGINLNRAAMQFVVERKGKWSDLPAIRDQLDPAMAAAQLQPVGPPQAAHAPLRYEYNICTFGYTMAWWGWPEWEREIDWMALHSINMPLALVGQEAAWLKLWTELFGVPAKDVLAHFTGPAFWPWHWMGNLRRWAGPVSLEYIERRRQLQVKILARMKELRMTYVLPAFAGHIPEAVGLVISKWYDEPLPGEEGAGDNRAKTFAEWFAGEARKRAATGSDKQQHVHRSALWMRFGPKYSNILTLHPTHPLFVRISTHFIRILNDMYGPAPFYSADQFNEMPPPSVDPGYLADAARAVVRGIQKVNRDARWVLQGWLFLHHRQIWGPTEVKAYLDGAGRGNVVLLDLGSDIRELIGAHKHFYGHDHIWCLLHSFGGRRGIFGDMESAVLGKMLRAAAIGKGAPTQLVGFGLTMEATHHNPALYELATDTFFQSSELDPITAPMLRNLASLENTHNSNQQNENRLLLQKRLRMWWELFFVRPRYDLTSAVAYAAPLQDQIVAAAVQLSRYGGPYGHPHDCCPSFSLIPFLPVFFAPVNDYALQGMSDMDMLYVPTSIFSAAAALLSAQSIVEEKRQQRTVQHHQQQQQQHEHPSEHHDTPLLYDTVDFSRQALDLVFTELHDAFQAILHLCGQHSAERGSSTALCPLYRELQELGEAMLSLILDMDSAMVATANFDLFDAWIGPAANWADAAKSEASKKEERFDVAAAMFNAKNLISSWGNSGQTDIGSGLGVQGYPNYAAKSWGGGLYSRLYHTRWKIAIDELLSLVRDGKFQVIAGSSQHTFRQVLKTDWQFCTNHTADHSLLQSRMKQKSRDSAGFWRAVKKWLVFDSSSLQPQPQSAQHQGPPPVPLVSAPFVKQTVEAFKQEYELINSPREVTACRFSPQKLASKSTHLLTGSRIGEMVDLAKHDLVQVRQRSSWVMHNVGSRAICSAMPRCVGFDALGAVYLSEKGTLRELVCDTEEEYEKLSEVEKKKREARKRESAVLFSKRSLKL